MPQNNPLNRYRKQADESASEPVSVPPSQQANGQTEPQTNESAGKQATKPTKSYRLHRSLTRAVAQWAFDHDMSESAAAEIAFRWLLDQEATP